MKALVSYAYVTTGLNLADVIAEPESISETAVSEIRESLSKRHGTPVVVLAITKLGEPVRRSRESEEDDYA